MPVSGWHSLRPYRIGIVDGIAFAAEGTQGMTVRKYDAYETLFSALVADEIDVAVAPRINGLVSSRDLEGIHRVGAVLETLFLYHYLHSSHADLQPMIETVLKEMLFDGTTRRLRDEAYAELLGDSP